MSETFQSEYGLLKSVLLKHPKYAYRSQEFLDSHWEELNYTSCPDYARACEEFDQFASILDGFGIEIQFLPGNQQTGPDSIYVRDPAITTNQGPVLCKMGKSQRETEPGFHHSFFDQTSSPVVGQIENDGRLEGGDVAWVDESTLAVGLGYRTNQQGVDQLKALVSDQVERFLVMHSPHHKGPADVFHLMSVFSPLDKDLALVYSPLMSVPFRQELTKMGLGFVETAPEEFETLGCNVLAIAPRVCIMVSGNPITKSRLEAAGVEVNEYRGEEISQKGCGGPTCLTRPLVRGR